MPISLHPCRARFVVGGILVAAGVATASAHPGVHTRIDAVTERIAADPTNADLYLKRGELYREHGDWDAALADYERAGQRESQNDAVLHARGQLFLDAGWPSAALVVLTEYVARHPDDGHSMIARARALSQLDRHLEAARQYTDALQYLHRLEPECYIARARCLADAGEDHLAHAIAGLDEGMAKLGPAVALQLYAIDLELRRGAYDRALGRIDQIASAAQRKERWLARKAEVLVKAGRVAQAVEAYEASLAAIESLPQRHRNTATIRELEQTVRQALGGLTVRTARKSPSTSSEISP